MDHPFNEDLRSILDDNDICEEFCPHTTWMEGSCDLLGQALHRLIPESELVTVGRVWEDGVFDHVVVKVTVDDTDLYIDYDGIHTHNEMRQKARLDWHIQHAAFGEYQRDALIECGVIGDESLIPRLAKILESRLGAIPLDRLSPLYAMGEEEECSP